MAAKDVFREFERFCIEYDIAIDEEDYEKGWNLDKKSKWPFLNLKGGLIFNFDFENEIRELHDKLDFNSLETLGIKLKIELFKALPDEAKRLIVVKRARAVLQKENSTNSLDSLDYLALYLLKNIPQIPHNVSTDIWNNYDDAFNFFLHVIYLNEISACYRGFTSIGYADQCLELIKKIIGKGKTPYELIALYNKGQGYHHNREYDKAYKEFEKVATPFSSADTNYFFNTSGKPWQFNLLYNDLFNKVAIIPAQVMQVECLIKMQRTWEAKDVLQKIHCSGYQKSRIKILNTRILIDQIDFDNLKENLDTFNLELMNPESILNIRDNLYNQVISLMAEGYQVLAKNYLEDKELLKDIEINYKIIENFFDQYRNLKKLLKKHNKNKTEESQAILLWVKGLKVVNLFFGLFKDKKLTDRIIKVVKTYLEMDSNQEQLFHSVTGFVLEDKGYRTNWDEIQKEYLDNLRDLRELMDQIKESNNFNSKEIALQIKEKELYGIDKILLNENRLKKWEKNKYKQQKQLINKDEILPSSQLKKIKEFLATQCFFPPKGSTFPEGCSSCSYNCNICPDFKDRIKNNPECTISVSADGPKYQHYFDVITQKNQRQLEDILLAGSNEKHLIGNGFGLFVLRRWNSYTPAMAASEGGGYFLFKTKDNKVEYGIVIDPGYNFLSNFFAEGLSINDIDAILISHDHPDHLEDFSKIITLKHEILNGRFNNSQKTRKITTVLSDGSYNKLRDDIRASYSVFKDTIVPKIGSSIALIDGISVQATHAIHPDVRANDSIGFLIEVQENTQENSQRIKIGFPCDTKWKDDIFDSYRECDIICYHAGAIIDKKITSGLFECFDNYKMDALTYKKNHLYIPGTVIFSKGYEDKKEQLRIISEFGEELKGGLRLDYAKKLAMFAENSNGTPGPVLPSDTGLLVSVLDKKIACTCCQEFYDYQFIKFEPFGSSERLFAFCTNCENKLTESQRHIKYYRKIEGHLREKDLLA